MNLDKFLCWFQSFDVQLDHVRVQHCPKSGFGLYSTKKITEQQILLLSIPQKLFIKPNACENENFSGFEQLISFLLENPTNPYVEFLKSIETVPQWRRNPTENYPKQLSDPMKIHDEKYLLSRQKFAQYSDELFQWAYYSINTRCVHFDMQIESKQSDDNLCLIPFLDFVNHSIEPNTISKYNSASQSYEIRSIQPIELDEQLTFLYNPHSNVDLFVEYGFVLPFNPSNQFDIRFQLEQILSQAQIDILKSFNYWNSLQFYAGDGDLSWTVLKAIELSVNEESWSPYDDPTQDLSQQLQNLLTDVRQKFENEFQQWKTEVFQYEKQILYNDFKIIIDDTSKSILRKCTK